MKLYDANHRYTAAAIAINDELCNSFKAILAKYPDMSPRDFGGLAHAAVEEIVCEAVLNAAEAERHPLTVAVDMLLDAIANQDQIEAYMRVKVCKAAMEKQINEAAASGNIGEVAKLKKLLAIEDARTSQWIQRKLVAG